MQTVVVARVTCATHTRAVLGFCSTSLPARRRRGAVYDERCNECVCEEGRWGVAVGELYCVCVCALCVCVPQNDVNCAAALMKIAIVCPLLSLFLA